MRSKFIIVVVVGAILVAGCGHPGFIAGSHKVSLQSPKPPPRVTLGIGADSYLGVYEAGLPDSYQKVAEFAAAVGRRPDIVMYFSGTRQPFERAFAERAHASGAVPLIQMQPGGISMAAIARGGLDSYLRTFADSVRAYRDAVIIGFAHEMNGFWYPWGYTHVPAATWVAAWRHVVTVFRRQGADNVTWLWTINDISPGTAPIHDYWPGRKYVTWVGIDGYLATPQGTFGSVFAASVAAVRRFSNDPILLSETAAGPEAGPAAKIPGLFAGVRQDHLLGLVWFDVAQHAGTYGQNWRLEDDPAALAVFRREVALFIR
jgi:hypothetical protein